MLKKVACLVAMSFVFFAACIFAGQNSVPDLTGKEWNLQDTKPVELMVAGSGGKNWGMVVYFTPVIRSYENPSEKILASLIMWPENKEGDELVMIWGTDLVQAQVALKIAGQWHVSVIPGEQSLKRSVFWGSNNKPVGIKLSVQSSSGFKEITIDLK